jgi:RNA polymerase sigma-70 factor (ECF subfamily)
MSEGTDAKDRQDRYVMSEQERDWVQQALGGDRSAFSRLVEVYQGPVYNLTYRLLGNPEEAEDAAQETFVRAFTRMNQYDPDRKFSTWLFSIANHHCIDRLRKRRATFVSIDDNPVLQNLRGKAPQPEQRAMASELSAEVQRLLLHLEPEYRTPLVLRYWEEYSYSEIAQAMDISVSAVKSRLFRARKQMAALVARSQEADTASQPRGERRRDAGLDMGKRRETSAYQIMLASV